MCIRTEFCRVRRFDSRRQILLFRDEPGIGSQFKNNGSNRQCGMRAVPRQRSVAQGSAGLEIAGGANPPDLNPVISAVRAPRRHARLRGALPKQAPFPQAAYATRSRYRPRLSYLPARNQTTNIRQAPFARRMTPARHPSAQDVAVAVDLVLAKHRDF